VKTVVDPQITQRIFSRTYTVHYHQVPMSPRKYTNYIPHVDKLENSSDNNKEIHTTLQM